MPRFDYTASDIRKSFLDAGLKAGDHMFTHSNIGFFGRLEGARKPEEYYQTFKDVLLDILGPEGTLIAPTFSYTFCHNKFFDVEETEGVCGAFSEMLRKDSDSIRSADPNFSVAAIGRLAEYFTEKPTEHSFGKGSFFDRFLEKDGKFVNMNRDSGSTFVHYVEKQLKVPYRYDKFFPGTLNDHGEQRKQTFVHFVTDYDKPDNGPCFTKLDALSKEKGTTTTANLGKGQIVYISARNTWNLIEDGLKTNPALLVKGDEVDLS